MFLDQNNSGIFSGLVRGKFGISNCCMMLQKTLLLAMESVISLMKEVELQEKAAVQAKEEAAQGGLDILHKVEELKMQLRLAKEANDMVCCTLVNTM